MQTKLTRSMNGCAFVENLSVLSGPSRTPFESFPTPWNPLADSSFAPSLLQNSLGSGIYCREELLSLGNPWLARCRSLSRALFCRSILPPSHARLRILQKAPPLTNSFAPLIEIFSLPDLWRIPLEPPPTPSWPFVDIFFPFRGNLSPLPDPWRIPLEPPPTPSWPFAVLRGPSWISFCLFLEIFLPCPTFGGSLSSLLQPLRGPSPFFVALRGYLFAFSWKSFSPARPLADPC